MFIAQLANTDGKYISRMVCSNPNRPDTQASMLKLVPNCWNTFPTTRRKSAIKCSLPKEAAAMTTPAANTQPVNKMKITALINLDNI